MPSYNWALACPGVGPVALSGATATIVAAPGGDIETANMTVPAKCNLTLLVTDNSSATATAVTTVTVMCVRAAGPCSMHAQLLHALPACGSALPCRHTARAVGPMPGRCQLPWVVVALTPP